MDSNSALPWSITISTASPKSIPTDMIGGKPADLAIKVAPLTGDYIEHRGTIAVANFVELEGRPAPHSLTNEDIEKRWTGVGTAGCAR